MSDKTEEPTPRRLRKAREQGDSPVSHVLVQAAGFVAALALAPAALSATSSRSAELMRAAITNAPGALAPAQLASEVLTLSVPIIAGSACAAVVLGLAQTGGMVSLNKLSPDLSRSNPFTNFRSLWSPQRFTSIVRSLIAAALIAAFATHLLSSHLADLAGTVGDVRRSTLIALRLSNRLAWFSASIGLALAAVDTIVTHYAWRKRHRMTKDELKREHREVEGDPEIKAARRRAHMEVLAGAAVASVREATVLIVNPTHLAVALHYVEESDDAPRIVAQGAGDLARRMIDAAHAYGVPVIRDVPIARALSELEVGAEIPELLYEAVAEILREVWAQNSDEKG